MDIVGLILMGVGALVLIVGSLWMLIETFKTGILWGIGSILLPFVSLIWLVTHWEEGKTPFLISIGGTTVMIVGALIGGGGSAAAM